MNFKVLFVIACLIVLMLFITIFGRKRKSNIREVIRTKLRKILISFNTKIKYREIEREKVEKIYAKKSKLYDIVNNIRIDSNFASLGLNSSQLFIFIIILAILTAYVTFGLLLDRIILAIFAIPIFIVMIFAILYWKSNNRHDERIEAIIDAENIVCNNIDLGVVDAVARNINQIPEIVRPEFEQFVDRVKNRNTHIRVALEMLRKDLGSTSDEFIKKCISAETDMQKGYIKSFADFVSMNGMIKDIRIEEKRQFEKVKSAFTISLVAILVFLFALIFIYEDIRNFYFKNGIGQLILLIDIAIITIEITYISYLRAKEL